VPEPGIHRPRQGPCSSLVTKVSRQPQGTGKPNRKGSSLATPHHAAPIKGSEGATVSRVESTSGAVGWRMSFASVLRSGGPSRQPPSRWLSGSSVSYWWCGACSRSSGRTRPGRSSRTLGLPLGRSSLFLPNGDEHSRATTGAQANDQVGEQFAGTLTDAFAVVTRYREVPSYP